MPFRRHYYKIQKPCYSQDFTVLFRLIPDTRPRLSAAETRMHEMRFCKAPP